VRRLLLTMLLALLVLPVAPAVAQDEPEPGSAQWRERDVANMERMTGRTRDQVGHPGYHTRLHLAAAELYAGNLADQARHPLRPILTLAQLVPQGRGADVYRRDWQQQGRGVMVPVEYRNRDGARIQGEVWAPPSPFADPVTGEEQTGPYPGVVITTGSIQGYKELYWWAAQGLAEAGYVVMTYDVQGQGKSETFAHDEDTGFIDCGPQGCPGVPFQQPANFIEGTEDALDWFLSGDNPLRGLVDGRRIGLAGHSLGGAAVTEVGNRDERVSAVVGWDNANLPADVEPRVPTMGQNAEVFFGPLPFHDQPDPDANNATYRRFVEAEVPAMQVALQGSTHMEWTYVPYILAASSHGERVAMHYTLAWFDRWLKGEPHGRSGAEARPPQVRAQAADARERLTATTFDDSADRSAIGTGTWQPPLGNLPHRIGGDHVTDHLSFYYRSSYAFDGRHCDDLYAGC
jgi:dienelactone hydrolase